MNNQELKVFTIILVVTTIVITLMGGTLAYWNWQSEVAQNTAVSFTVASNFSCSADGGGNITNSNVMIVPATCTNSAHAIKREVKVNVNKNGANNIYLDMYLNVNSLGTGLSNTTNFKYALTTSGTSCTDGVVAQGDFRSAGTNTKKNLLINKEYTQTTQNDTYYLWIWLDALETSTSTQNQSFDLSLAGSCTDQAPTTFSGTIYRYSTEKLSIGDSILPTVINKWCDVENDSGTVYDCFDTENECNQFLQNEGYTETDTCKYGVTKGGLTSYETNPSNLNKTFYLKHVIVDDIVTESYVEFVVTPTMVASNLGMTAGTYYLRGLDTYDVANDTCKSEYYDSQNDQCVSPYYEENKATLLRAFGSTYCTDYSSSFVCNVSGLHARAYLEGMAEAGDADRAYCRVESDGISDCRE